MLGISNNRFKWNHLSSSRRVESRQLAKIQLPSFEREIQLTGCPKSSEISLQRHHWNMMKYSGMYNQVMSDQGLILSYWSSTYRPIRMSNVRTVPSTLPAIISVGVKQMDITLSKNVSMIYKNVNNVTKG